MRVTFHRLPDHTWADVDIERDDGVAYRMHAGPVTAEAPHDLVHYTVEHALSMADGIWGSIAGGVVFRSMTHVSGRRPPHAAERSAQLLRANREQLLHAELIGGFVERAAEVPPGELDLVRFTAEQRGNRFRRFDGAAVMRAIEALRAARERWAALPVGADLTLLWPRHRQLRAPEATRSGRRAPATARRR